MISTADGVGGTLGSTAQMENRFFINASHGGVGVNAAANDYQMLAVNGNTTDRGDNNQLENISIRCTYSNIKASNTVIGVMWRPAWASSDNTTDISGFSANPGGFTGSGKITNLYGFQASNQIGSAWSATNNYGFYSSVNSTSTSGQKNYGFYSSGSADNYFAGYVGIGTNDPQHKVHIKGEDARNARLTVERTGSGAGVAFASVDSNGTVTACFSSATDGGKSILFYTGAGASTVRASISSAGVLNVNNLNGSGNRNVRCRQRWQPCH